MSVWQADNKQFCETKQLSLGINEKLKFGK